MLPSEMKRCRKCGLVAFGEEKTCHGCRSRSFDSIVHEDVTLADAIAYIKEMDGDRIYERDACLAALADLAPHLEAERNALATAFNCGAVGLLARGDVSSAMRRMDKAYLSAAIADWIVDAYLGSESRSEEQRVSERRVVPSQGALVRCPDCGKEVSPRADACPNCGCPGRFFSKDGSQVREVRGEGTTEQVGGSPRPSATLKAGDPYTFGTYGGEDIVWRVLDVKGGRALLITEKAIDCRPYNDEMCDTTWADCSLRTWLNGEFLHSAFTDSQRGRVVEASVANKDNGREGTLGGPDTKDRVFCLSSEEAYRYFADDDDRICYPTHSAKENGAWTSDSGACLWWLRSPGGFQFFAALVIYGGDVGEGGIWVNNDFNGVRPALWLDL